MPWMRPTKILLTLVLVIWQPLVRQTFQYDIVIVLVLMLLTYIAAWLKYFVETSATTQQNASSSILQDIVIDDILEHCLKNPNF
jgi:hypothetical protein